jgi:hypothetical protein
MIVLASMLPTRSDVRAVDAGAQVRQPLQDIFWRPTASSMAVRASLEHDQHLRDVPQDEVAAAAQAFGNSRLRAWRPRGPGDFG